MTEDEIKEIARTAIAASEAYLRGALGPMELHQAALNIIVDVEGARLSEALWILATAMERTGSQGGTHEVRWRNVMSAMVWVVKMHLGEGLHPDDKPAAEVKGDTNELQLLLAVARVLLVLHGRKPAMRTQDRLALLDAALAPFQPQAAHALGQALAIVNGQQAELSGPPLEQFVKDAMERVAALPLEQQQAMWEEQKRSWVRGEMALKEADREMGHG